MMYDEFDDRDERIAGGADPVHDREAERQEFPGKENDVDVIDGFAAEESAVDAAGADRDSAPADSDDFSQVTSAGNDDFGSVTGADSDGFGSAASAGNDGFSPVTGADSDGFSSVTRAGNDDFGSVTGAGNDSFGSVTSAGNDSFGSATSAGNDDFGSVTDAGSDSFGGPVTSADRDGSASFKSAGSDGTGSASGQTSGTYGTQPRPTETEPGQGFYHYSYREENRRPRTEPLPEQKKHRSGGSGRRPLWKSVAICAGLAVVFGVVGSAAFQVTNLVGRKVLPQESEYTVGTADTVAQTEAQSEMKVSGTTVSTGGTPSQVAKNAMPSIVAITNKGVQEVQMFFRTYQQEVESAGSGVIVSQNDDELLIATNNHVVADATELSVCFTVDTEDQEDAVMEAQVKGTDVEHDLAIIAVKLSDIPDNVKSQIKAAPIGDSSTLELGQQVVAIGNALGSGQSVTVGYISALDREVTVSDENRTNTVTNSMIQTDAAINGGNSGGALLNMAGELIGINSAKAVDTGVEGMGYAIPMQTAQPILEELMQRKTRTEVDTEKMGYMGVTPRDVSEEAKEVYNMPAGAFIYEVEEGSPAEAAGIKKGDIITKMDGQSITSKDDLFDRMNYYEAGETIDVVVATAEGGEYVERTVSVTLGERPADLNSGTQQGGQELPQEQYGEDGYGYGEGDGYGYDFTDPFQQFFGN